MSTFFISDLHLASDQPRLFAAFEAFLQGPARNAESLYILGDFFDAWIGDDDDDEFLATVKNLLSRYSAAGTTVYVLHGNRDFLLGKTFAEQTGSTLLAESTVIDLYGRQVLIMHGDSLCTQDVEYQQFRAMVRNPSWQQQVLALPLPQRRLMAANLRQQSQSMNAMKAEDIMDVTPEEVTQALRNAAVNLLIHGHTHRPDRHRVSLDGLDAERIVLGAWHDQGWFLQAGADGSLDLRSFAIPQ